MAFGDAAMIDLETGWRQGRIHALRRMPAHWTLHVTTDWRATLYVGARLAVRTVGIVAAIVVLLVIVAETGR